MGKTTQEIRFILKRCTCLLISFTSDQMFSANWDMGVFSLVGRADQGERAVSTLVTSQGININHLWGHLQWGAISCTKAKPPPNTDKLPPLALSTLHTRHKPYRWNTGSVDLPRSLCSAVNCSHISEVIFWAIMITSLLCNALYSSMFHPASARSSCRRKAYML